MQNPTYRHIATDFINAPRNVPSNPYIWITPTSEIQKRLYSLSEFKASKLEILLLGVIIYCLVR